MGRAGGTNLSVMLLSGAWCVLGSLALPLWAQVPPPRDTVKDSVVSVALDNIREAGDAYPIQQLSRCLRKYPKAARFHMTWDIGVGPAQDECIVDYDRSQKVLTFYAFGTFSLEGPSIGCHYKFSQVADSKLHNIASQRTFSPASRVSRRRKGIVDNRIVDDPTYLPWFNELRRYGCPRKKLAWKPLR